MRTKIFEACEAPCDLCAREALIEFAVSCEEGWATLFVVCEKCSRRLREQLRRDSQRRIEKRARFKLNP